MKKQNKPIDVHPRRMARRIAKAKMERAGWTRINRYFRASWRSALAHK